MATINELDAAIACGEEAVECARLHQNNGYDAVRLRLDEIALEALQDARRRMDGCEWCRHHGEPSHVVWDTNVIKVLGDANSKDGYQLFKWRGPQAEEGDKDE